MRKVASSPALHEILNALFWWSKAVPSVDDVVTSYKEDDASVYNDTLVYCLYSGVWLPGKEAKDVGGYQVQEGEDIAGHAVFTLRISAAGSLRPWRRQWNAVAMTAMALAVKFIMTIVAMTTVAARLSVSW
jgi:hypothetical protein